jgi:hypothetical protein
LFDLASDERCVLVGLAIDCRSYTDQHYRKYTSKPHDYGREAGVVSDIRDGVVDAELM